MSGRAWSLLHTLPAAFLCAFLLHPAAVYAHFLFNSAPPVKQSFENFPIFSALRISLTVPPTHCSRRYWHRHRSFAVPFTSPLLPAFPLLEWPRRSASRPEDAS